MTKTLIIPGRHGADVAHWQHWWAMRDPAALIVAQEPWAADAPDAWEMQVAGAILAHPGSILVGHGYGAVVAARLLTHWPQLQVAGALLVAPADPASGPLPEGRITVPALLVASRNDPHLPFAAALHQARLWGVEPVDIGRAGHVDTEAGFGPWPEGMELRDGLLGGLRSGIEPAPAAPQVVRQL